MVTNIFNKIIKCSWIYFLFIVAATFFSGCSYNYEQTIPEIICVNYTATVYDYNNILTNDDENMNALNEDNETEDVDIVNNEPPECDEPPAFSFFGTWLLEKIAYTWVDLFLTVNMDIYFLPIDVEEFLGFELEFTHEYVRLGERKLYSPVYELTYVLESNLFLPNDFWFPGSYRIEAGYAESFQNVFEKLRNHDNHLGYEDPISGEVYFIRVGIKYPQYPDIWFRGNFLDPELLTAFNPLFEGFFLLSDEFMLTRGNTQILTRKIN